MRIAVVGASGKVGSEVLNLIEASESNFTALPIVSDASTSLDEVRQPKKNAFMRLSDAAFERCDAVIDFTTPSATMKLLDLLDGLPTPLVVGTTGFTDEQQARLETEKRNRAILVGANFTQGFEPFLKAGADLISSLPFADVTVGEIYHRHKKKTASGTTERMTKLYELIDGADGAPRHVNQRIERIAAIPGINIVELSLGFATIEMKLTVRSRMAYAAGAIEAAKWLIGRPAGFFTPADKYV